MKIKLKAKHYTEATGFLEGNCALKRAIDEQLPIDKDEQLAAGVHCISAYKKDNFANYRTYVLSKAHKKKTYEIRKFLAHFVPKNFVFETVEVIGYPEEVKKAA
jgi:hypothetical protein